MQKIRVAIIGWGNIGRASLEAVLEAPDMELAGIVRRTIAPIGFDVPIVDDITKLGKVDAVILALPSRLVPAAAETYLKQGFVTIDSFDIHTEIADLQTKLHQVAKENNTRAVVAAGWDPGSDSVVRTLLEAIAPKGLTHTNFGPGMSMGHSVAVKAVKGVKAALSMTIPKGEGIHRRMVYVEIESGANFDTVAATIKADPYFAHDETYVYQVDNVDALKDMGHGVNMIRKGVSGQTQNQNFAFTMSINNPALTGQILVSCTRAAFRQTPGCYTMIELPPVDLLPGDRHEWVKKLV